MIPKIVTLLVWILCIANLFVRFPDPAGLTLILVLGFIVVAHVIECAVFAKRLLNAKGSTLGHFIQVFLFGYFHLMTLQD